MPPRKTKKRTAFPEVIANRIIRNAGINLSDEGLTPQKAIELVLDEIWNDEWYVRRFLKKFSLPKRKLLVHDPGMSKVDMYIINLIKSSDGKRIKVAAIIEQVYNYYRIRYSAERVKQLRKIVYNAKYKNLEDPAEA